MQKKIGTILDDKLLAQARIFSQKEHITISRLIQESLSEFIQRKKRPPSLLSAVDSSFGALKITPRELKNILKENLYEIN